MTPGSYLIWSLMGHAWSIAPSLLENARAESIQRSHVESHPYFTYVEHLKKKKSTSFQRPQV